jgi:hypothetical protein
MSTNANVSNPGPLLFYPATVAGKATSLKGLRRCFGSRKNFAPVAERLKQQRAVQITSPVTPGSFEAVTNLPGGGFAICVFHPDWGRATEEEARGLMTDMAAQSGPGYEFMVMPLAGVKLVSLPLPGGALSPLVGA